MVNSYDKVVKRLVEYRKRLGWSQEKKKGNSSGSAVSAVYYREKGRVSYLYGMGDTQWCGAGFIGLFSGD